MANATRSSTETRREEDVLLARRAAAGDEGAFRSLVFRYQAPVLALARNLVGSADGEDVAQDAFVSAWLHLTTFDPDRGAFFTWLARITRNRALNSRKRRRPRTIPDLPDPAGPDDAAAGAERSELHRRLDAALADLPAEQRAAFVLAEIHEMPLAEVAEIEGVPVGTVKSRSARAREKLRAALTEGTVEP